MYYGNVNFCFLDSGACKWNPIWEKGKQVIHILTFNQLLSFINIVVDKKTQAPLKQMLTLITRKASKRGHKD